jgi:hypothetical protein
MPELSISELERDLESARDESCHWQAWGRERLRSGTSRHDDGQIVLAAQCRAYTAWQRLEAAKTRAVS